MLFHRGRPADSVYNLHSLCQAQGFFPKNCTAAFDFGHVKHLIDKPQKMPGGIINLAQTVQNPLWILQMIHGNLGHTQDSVHRCTDVVRHTVQEHTLGLIRFLCGLVCCL